MTMGRPVDTSDIRKLNGLPENASFSMSDDKHTRINGTIEQGATIHKTGKGLLFIAGQVMENVKFIISDMGDVVFAIRPPESVVLAIEKSGKGEVIMPGGYQPSWQSKNTVSQADCALTNGFNTVNIFRSVTALGASTLTGQGLSSASSQQAVEMRTGGRVDQQVSPIYPARRASPLLAVADEREKPATLLNFSP